MHIVLINQVVGTRFFPYLEESSNVIHGPVFKQGFGIELNPISKDVIDFIHHLQINIYIILHKKFDPIVFKGFLL